MNEDEFKTKLRKAEQCRRKEQSILAKRLNTALEALEYYSQLVVPVPDGNTLKPLDLGVKAREVLEQVGKRA